MIELKKITYDNMSEILKLQVADDQKGFVANNLESLADAYVGINSGYPTIPYGIYADDSAVGLIMYYYNNPEDHEEPEDIDLPSYLKECTYFMQRLMIDKNHQGKGYGKEAVKKMIAEIKTKPYGPAESIYTSIEPKNFGAETLYSSLGFIKTGEVDGGELVMKLEGI